MMIMIKEIKQEKVPCKNSVSQQLLLVMINSQLVLIITTIRGLPNSLFKTKEIHQINVLHCLFVLSVISHDLRGNKRFSSV